MSKLTAMLANEVDGSITDYLTNQRYAMEQKLDGHRILLYCHKGELHVVNRNHEVSQHHHRMQSPGWLSNLLPLKGRSVVFDAELIGDTAWIFDLPRLEGIIDEGTPWRYRNIMLRSLFNEIDFNHHLKLVPTAITTDQKISLAERCLVENVEGIMIKDRDAPYVSGRSDSMLKVKFIKTADLIILRIGDEGKQAATLGAYDDGEVIEVGRCSLVGKGEVEVGDVVEVRYLYLSDAGRLVQPTLLRVRDDKYATECTTEQLIGTNRAVLLGDSHESS